MAQFLEPSPGNQSSSSADAYVGQLIAQALASRQPSDGGADMPIVPLWRVRPASPKQSGSGAGSSAAADRAIGQAHKSLFQVGPGPGVGTVLAAQPGEPSEQSYRSVAAAEAYWLDMSEEDRQAFMEAAKREGFWKPAQGGDGLVAAWGKAVSLAAQYNQTHDKGKWISPFEAIEKMAIKGMADDGLAHDGFSTETTYRKFSQNELMSNAKAVLQQQLGRNPTGSEMKAYTAAVNAASMQHPQTVTRQQVDDGMGGTSAVTSVTGGSFDPNAVIDAQVTGTKEFRDFQAATTYYQAAMQALDSVV